MADERGSDELFPTVCDMCGKALLLDENVRYILRAEVFAAYDVLELTREDLEKATRREIEELIDRMGDMDEQELADSVYKKFVFNLCPRCQRRYIEDPLGVKRHGKAGED